MKVGYVAPMSIAAVSGGMRTQAVQTVSHIKAFGVEGHFVSPWDDINELELDLVHVFGASIENIGIVNQVKALGLPLALSPVFFSNRSASTIRKALKIEQLNASFLKGLRTDFGIKSELCNKADIVLPNTSDEALLITNGLSVPEKKVKVVPNGVEYRFADATSDLFVNRYGIEGFVLFAGQAGAPRKNVIKLLQIAPKLPEQVVIIGSLYEDEYGDKCRSLAKKADNVTLIETLDHESDMLASAYAACKVFVLPSQFETPGIAAMEAALNHANIVITERGGTKDYFDGFAEFINPDSSSSLLNGIQKALKKGKSAELKEHILQNFTWKQVAEQTANQYKRILA